jgi:hypothetical protein
MIVLWIIGYLIVGIVTAALVEEYIAHGITDPEFVIATAFAWPMIVTILTGLGLAKLTIFLVDWLRSKLPSVKWGSADENHKDGTPGCDKWCDCQMRDEN